VGEEADGGRLLIGQAVGLKSAVLAVLAALVGLALARARMRNKDEMRMMASLRARR